MVVYINGSEAFRGGGSNTQDVVTPIGAIPVPAGNIPIDIQWNGHTSMNLTFRAIDGQGSMR
jgi:hypothetical protein